MMQDGLRPNFVLGEESLAPSAPVFDPPLSFPPAPETDEEASVLVAAAQAAELSSV